MEKKSIDMSKYKKLDVISIVINGEENKGAITSEEMMKTGKITVDMVVNYKEESNSEDNIENEK